MIAAAPKVHHSIPVGQIALPADLQSYHVVLPVDALDEQGNLLDWVIDFAFDTLDARRLDLRIVAETDKGA